MRLNGPYVSNGPKRVPAPAKAPASAPAIVKNKIYVVAVSIDAELKCLMMSHKEQYSI